MLLPVIDPVTLNLDVTLRWLIAVVTDYGITVLVVAFIAIWCSTVVDLLNSTLRSQLARYVDCRCCWWTRLLALLPVTFYVVDSSSVAGYPVVASPVTFFTGSILPIARYVGVDSPLLPRLIYVTVLDVGGGPSC